MAKVVAKDVPQSLLDVLNQIDFTNTGKAVITEYTDLLKMGLANDSRIIKKKK